MPGSMSGVINAYSRGGHHVKKDVKSRFIPVEQNVC